jgi:hypothetical protein
VRSGFGRPAEQSHVIVRAASFHAWPQRLQFSIDTFTKLPQLAIAMSLHETPEQ